MGPLFSARVKPNRYDSVRESVGNIPTAAVIRSHCSQHGISTGELVRIAIGDLTAIRKGRVLPVGRQEIVQTIVWAIEDGLDTEGGWRKRWDQFASRKPYLCTSAYLSKGAKRAGASLEGLVIEAMHIYEVKDGQVEVSRTVVPQMVEAAIAECWTSAALKRAGVRGQKLWDLKDEGRLIGFRLPNRTYLYPKWQFDEDFQVRPVARELFQFVESEKILLSELHELVQEAKGHLDLNQGIRRLPAEKRRQILRVLNYSDLWE